MLGGTGRRSRSGRSAGAEPCDALLVLDVDAHVAAMSNVDDRSVQFMRAVLAIRRFSRSPVASAHRRASVSS